MTQAWPPDPVPAPADPDPRQGWSVPHDPQPRRVLRSPSQRWIAGVAGGLSEHTGQPAGLFRVAFVVAALAGGAGVVAYALFWLFLPLRPDRPDDAGGGAPSRSWAGADLTGLLGVVALGLGVLLGLSALGIPVQVSIWAPVILVGAGVVVLWRQGDEAQRALGAAPSANATRPLAVLTDRRLWVRVLVGAGLLVVGVLLLVVPRIDLRVLAQALVAAAAVGAGILLIVLPWLSTWIRAWQAERYATVRAEERAAMAARVHDSVLQTLTLIQRRADDPREVTRLARTEERALRSWLYAPAGPSGSLAAALAAVVADTEADYDVRIELVTVGDLPVDERLAALVAATREAVVNVAKHAAAPATVYVEVDDTQVEVNVKDRGCGFDPESIAADRLGVRRSIVERIETVGGRASVRSAPGEGTEVRLIVPREPADD